MTALNCFEWAMFVNQKFGLQIADISNLNPGDKLDLLVLDRNVWDIALREEHNKPNIIHDPADFFRENFGIYIHEYDLIGKMILYAKSIEIPKVYQANISPMGISKNNILIENFEFHIEYKDHYWYPLTNGYLPKTDIQGIYGDFGFGKEMHWTDFSPTTKIGYRGPIILKSNLKLLPGIYWEPPPKIETGSNFSFSSVSSNSESDDQIINIENSFDSDSTDSMNEINQNEIETQNMLYPIDLIPSGAESDSGADIDFSFSSVSNDES